LMLRLTAHFLLEQGGLMFWKYLQLVHWLEKLFRVTIKVLLTYLKFGVAQLIQLNRYLQQLELTNV
jgi:hypothetical protein